MTINKVQEKQYSQRGPSEYGDHSRTGNELSKAAIFHLVQYNIISVVERALPICQVYPLEALEYFDMSILNIAGRI